MRTGNKALESVKHQIPSSSGKRPSYGVKSLPVPSTSVPITISTKSASGPPTLTTHEPSKWLDAVRSELPPPSDDPTITVGLRDKLFAHAIMSSSRTNLLSWRMETRVCPDWLV